MNEALFFSEGTAEGGALRPGIGARLQIVFRVVVTRGPDDTAQGRGPRGCQGLERPRANTRRRKITRLSRRQCPSPPPSVCISHGMPIRTIRRLAPYVDDGESKSSIGGCRFRSCIGRGSTCIQLGGEQFHVAQNFYMRICKLSICATYRAGSICGAYRKFTYTHIENGHFLCIYARAGKETTEF